MVYHVNALSTNPNKIDSPGPTMWKENSLQVVLWAVCALWYAFSHTKWSPAKNPLFGKLRHIAHGMHCECMYSFPSCIQCKRWVHFLSWTPVQRFCCREWAQQSNSSTCDWQLGTLYPNGIVASLSSSKSCVMICCGYGSGMILTSLGCLLASAWCGSRLPTFLCRLTLPHWLLPNVHRLWTQEHPHLGSLAC